MTKTAGSDDFHFGGFLNNRRTGVRARENVSYMRRRRRILMRPTGRVLSCILAAYFFAGVAATSAVAQGSYRAQLRGVVSDATGAVVHGATVTITDTGTNISSVARTDDKGEYYFTGLFGKSSDSWFSSGRANGCGTCRRSGRYAQFYCDSRGCE